MTRDNRTIDFSSSHRDVSNAIRFNLGDMMELRLRWRRISPITAPIEASLTNVAKK